MMLGSRKPRWDESNPLPNSEPLALDVPLVQMPAARPPRDKSREWAGILADGLLGLAGQSGVYAPMIERRRQEQTAFEAGEQRYQRQRADSRDDFLWKQQHEAKNPYRFEDNAGNVRELGPDGNVRILFEDPTPKEKWVFDPVRGYVNINALTPPASAQPRRFDALPPGAVPLGGAGPQTPRTFR